MTVQDLMTALTWTQAICLVLSIWLVYATGLAVQRLWFSPISHFPGPRLAALTQYYEFYYDTVLGGQFSNKLVELHKVYGPVVRINPREVHVAEYDFYSKLYSGTARPLDKWTFWTQQSGAPHNVVATVNYDHHKMLRSALSPFLSTESAHKLQPLVEERVDALLDALVKYVNTNQDKPLNVMYPLMAFTYDVINEYAFARSTHLIENEDFGAEITDSLLTGTHMGPFFKLVNCFPESFSGRLVPGWGEFLKIKNDILNQIRDIDASLRDMEKGQLDASESTIFHDMLSSRTLLPQDKTLTRLTQDGLNLVQDGTLSTAWTISLAIFHLLNQPSTLRELRDELFAAIPHSNSVVPLNQLEDLPYLQAVVKESLRLGMGTSGRLTCVAPHETLTCADKMAGMEWQIPPGSVVSMSPYMTIMDDSVFYDSRGFHPERWLVDGDCLDKYLVIFDGGARNSPGLALAKAEISLVLAKLFRKWGSDGVGDEGDRRPGDIGFFRIFETEVEDNEITSRYSSPILYKNIKGLRFVLETC